MAGSILGKTANMAGVPSRRYRDFIKQIAGEIRQARLKAYRTANKQLLDLYLYIGRGIYEKVEIAKWGEGVVEKMSRDLHRVFPDMRGFSAQNLWRMKQIFEVYKGCTKLSTLLRELPWSHNLLILHRTETLEEKEFYIKAAINGKWSCRDLQRQMDTAFYERFALSKKPKILLHGNAKEQLISDFKDTYALDFLGLKDEFSENDLRQSILANLRQFFLEFGRFFTFVGSEYKIAVGDEDYKVDLLFYHRMLRCLVAVDLKIGKFKPEYTGKMQFYLSALDEKEKLGNENSSVGLVLCKSKDEETVRIAMSGMKSQLKVSSYKTGIIDRKLLQEKLHSLPLPN
ncbi:MAG: DUF1016 domain-containing protein [Planctomycetes bacterium]|nr:DUF1016 domain-containing protein [Planctomycetota bacterium]